MNSPNDNANQPEAAADEKLLVAYLDGELNSEEAESVEQRLTREVDLRNSLRDLQQTWDMLDQLPSPDVGESFTRSTIEMVVKEVQSDSEGKSWRVWKWPIRIACALALLLGSAALSFLFARNFQLAPKRELTENLSFYESVDLYLYIPSIQFLNRLDETGVLPEQFVSSENIEAVEDETPTGIESASQRLENMDEKQLIDLRRKKDRFEAYPEFEQLRRRELHTSILASPNSQRLQKLAEKYKNWTRSISGVERTKLLEMETVDEQIEEIRRLRTIQEEEFFGLAGATELPKQDVPALSDWVEKFVNEKFLETCRIMRIPPDNRRITRYSKPLQPFIMFQFYLRQTNDGAKFVDEEALGQMVDSLSVQAKQIVTDQGDIALQLKLATAWIEWACQAKTNPPLTDQTLFEFLNKLPPERAERYDDMSPSQWRRELEQLYYREHRFN